MIASEPLKLRHYGYQKWVKRFLLHLRTACEVEKKMERETPACEQASFGWILKTIQERLNHCRNQRSRVPEAGDIGWRISFNRPRLLRLTGAVMISVLTRWGFFKKVIWIFNFVNFSRVQVTTLNRVHYRWKALRLTMPNFTTVILLIMAALSERTPQGTVWLCDRAWD